MLYISISILGLLRYYNRQISVVKYFPEKIIRPATCPQKEPFRNRRSAVGELSNHCQ